MFVIQYNKKNENFLRNQAITQNILINTYHVLCAYNTYLVHLCYALCGTMGAYNVYIVN